MSNKLIKAQENLNDSLLDMMCLTFDKELLKHLITLYNKSNKLTDDILALKEESKR